MKRKNIVRMCIAWCELILLSPTAGRLSYPPASGPFWSLSLYAVPQPHEKHMLETKQLKTQQIFASCAFQQSLRVSFPDESTAAQSDLRVPVGFGTMLCRYSQVAQTRRHTRPVTGSPGAGEATNFPISRPPPTQSQCWVRHVKDSLVPVAPLIYLESACMSWHSDTIT